MTLYSKWCQMLLYCGYSGIPDRLEIILSQQVSMIHPLSLYFSQVNSQENILSLCRGAAPAVIYGTLTSHLCSRGIILY